MHIGASLAALASEKQRRACAEKHGARHQWRQRRRVAAALAQRPRAHLWRSSGVIA